MDDNPSRNDQNLKEEEMEIVGMVVGEGQRRKGVI